MCCDCKSPSQRNLSKSLIDSITPTQFSALVRIHENKNALKPSCCTGMDVATVKGVVGRLIDKGLSNLVPIPSIGADISYHRPKRATIFFKTWYRQVNGLRRNVETAYASRAENPSQGFKETDLVFTKFWRGPG